VLQSHTRGQGGIDEMHANMTDDEVFYGLFRVTEKYALSGELRPTSSSRIDMSVTVKFGYVKLMSPKLPAMTKVALPHLPAPTRIAGWHLDPPWLHHGLR
jgi:hypothetical protein